MGWIPSGGTSLTVAESDGTPSVSGVSTILVSNTTLTDNTGGSVTIAMTPAGGANTALSNLASVAINAAVSPGADNTIVHGTTALRFSNFISGGAFSIYKAASEANPTATLGSGVLNFGAGTTNAVDVGLKRSSGGVLYVTDGSSGQGDLNAHGLVITDTTMVTNLNADTVDGSHAAAFAKVALDNLASVAINVPLVTGVGTALTLAAAAPITDAAPSISLLRSADAFPGATVNTTGANTILAGGIGRRIFTVVAYNNGTMASSTITVVENGESFTITEGSDWDAETSEAVTATNIAAAIVNSAQFIQDATAVGAVVRIVPGPSVYSLTIAKTAADAGMTATSGTDGVTQTAGDFVLGKTAQVKFADYGTNDILIYSGASFAAGFELSPGVGGSYGPKFLFYNSTGNPIRMGDNQPGGMGGLVQALNLASGTSLNWNADVGFVRISPGLVKVYDGVAQASGPSATGSGNIEASTAITAVGTAAANGYIRTGVYKRAWTNAEVVALGATKDAELKIATLPAKTVVRNAYVVVDTKESYLSDLTVALGRTGATYIDYIVASNAKAETLGSELVTNGAFTGNATGWTLGAGGGTPDWFYDTDKVSHAADSATGTLTPTTPLVAVVGTQYKLTWTMAHTSGTGVTASFGGVSGTQRASGATFNEYFTATSTATLTFTPTANWVGSVDTVILKEVARTVYGDLITERGTNLTGYDLPSYTAVTDVYLNFVTTDGTYNLANALQSTGTVYLMTETLP